MSPASSRSPHAKLVSMVPFPNDPRRCMACIGEPSPGGAALRVCLFGDLSPKPKTLKARLRFCMRAR
eukprot:3447494-Prymnesium_polylepis.1